MKNLFLVFIFAAILTSCNPQSSSKDTERSFGDYSIKVIDSCEYIEYDYGIVDQRVYSLTHKGNCKFCKQRRNE